MRFSAAMVVLVAAAMLHAQQQPTPVQPVALKHGRLVVWVVHPTIVVSAPTDYGGSARRPPGYNEQTAGSFGQTASSVGTSASNTGLPSDSPLISRTGRVADTVAPADRDATAAAAAGYREQTAGSFGQTAGKFGTEASNHGQAPSTVGQNASSVGTDSSNYGQMAGSYGHSLSTIAQAGQPEHMQIESMETIVEPKLRVAYPDLSVQFVTVDLDKFPAMLRTASASTVIAGLYPDVLVFEGFPASWEGLPQSVQRLVKESFGGSAPVKNGPGSALAARRVVVTMRSRQQATAIAFAEYLQNQGLLKVPAR
jgi:hypothetical protein